MSLDSDNVSYEKQFDEIHLIRGNQNGEIDFKRLRSIYKDMKVKSWRHIFEQERKMAHYWFERVETHNLFELVKRVKSDF